MLKKFITSAAALILLVGCGNVRISALIPQAASEEKTITPESSKQEITAPENDNATEISVTAPENSESPKESNAGDIAVSADGKKNMKFDVITKSFSDFIPDNKNEGTPFNFLLPCEYEQISKHHAGFKYLVKDGNRYLVDNNNTVICPTDEYDIISLWGDKIEIRLVETGLYGIIDYDGNVIMKPQHKYALSFSNGLAPVSQNGKIGFMDITGKIVINYRYDSCFPFSEGLTAVGINGDKQYVFINAEGRIKGGPYNIYDAHKTVYPFIYTRYKEGFTAYYESCDKGREASAGKGYWGFGDADGNVAISARYKAVRPFSDGLASVMTKDDEWIYIDSAGNKIMDGYGSDFENGIACFDNKFIDKNGNTVLEIQAGYHPRIGLMGKAENFYKGLIVVQRVVDGRWSCGVMDMKGNIRLESQEFDEITIYDEGLVAVQMDDKWGIIDIS